MTISITHGEPVTHFFLIAYPKRPYNEPRGCDGKTIIELKDEKTKKVINARFFGSFDIPIEEFSTRVGLARLAYGVEAPILKEALLKKYPELHNPGAIVEYWILKRI